MSVRDDPTLETIGHYRIESRLGEGELGTVYRAWDERLERWVTLKQAVANDPAALDRFRHGARAIAGLGHPSLMRIYDFVDTDESSWLVMEFVEGQTLRKLLGDGALDPGQAVRLAREVAEGLAAVHAQDIVLLSLKTGSVLVSAEGHAKILEFGLARLLGRDRNDNPILETGAVRGALGAMAPEQAMDQAVDHRSDLFSLGILLYEMVTGSSPFEGASEVQTLQRLCTHRQESARQLNARVPAVLSDLIDQLLEKNPGQRPGSAREVVASLRAIETSGNPGSGTVRLSDLADVAGYLEDDGPSEPTAAQLISLKTLLVTDLVGSTQLVENLGDVRAADVLARHDRLARDLVTRHKGREIDKTDGFLILFKRPVDAVRFALRYHQELTRLSGEEGVELKARVGVHLGEVILIENPAQDVLHGAKPIEVQGLAKPIAARLMSLAQGGQTLLSRAAFDLSRRAMEEEPSQDHPVRWLSYGEYSFKGVAEGLRVFEVGVEGLAPLTPPADVEKARRVVAGGAEGRRWRWPAIALVLVAALLLALAVKQLVLPSGGSTSVRTRPAIAVLGFKNLSGRTEIAWLSTALAELFSTDLATGGQLRLIPGESIARMKREISLPDVDTLGSQTLEAIAGNLGTDFVLLGSYLPVGEEQDRRFRLLVRLQDTRREENIVALTESGTEAELFELVSRTGRVLRQKLGIGALSTAEEASLRAVLSSSPEANRLYSEGLLSLRDLEAMTARDRLLKAVELDPGFAVAHAALSEAWRALGYDREALKSARKAFETVQGLTPAESLLIEGRYREASGDWDGAVEAHRALWQLSPGNVDYGLRLAQAQIGAGRGHDALATLESLRAVPPPAGDDPRIDLAESSAAASLSDYPGQLEAAERAVRKGRDRDAWILVAEGRQRQWRALRSLGRSDEAREALEEARRLLEAAGDRGRLAEVLNGIAILLEDEGRGSEAEGLYRRALEIHREIGNRKGIAEMQNSLADLVMDRGELAAAKSLVDGAVAAAVEVGDREKEAKYLDTRVWILIHQGALAEAAASARQAQTICREIGHREGVAWASYYLGRIAFDGGKLARAAERYEEAAAIGREIDNKYLLSFVLAGQGDVLLAGGDLESAWDRSTRAAELSSQLDEPAELVETQLTRIRLLLEMERAGEAEALARRVTTELKEGDGADHEASAAALLARILVTRGQLEGARRALELASARAATSQNPKVRLSVALAEAHLLAATREYGPALGTLAAVDAESETLGLVGLGLEARLERGAIETASGTTAAGHARLETLAAEAQDLGYGLIARRAAARL